MTSTIIVDAMGGDHCPDAAVEASLSLFAEKKPVQIILVGKESEIMAAFPKNSKKSDNLDIVNADEVILMDESPSAVVRKKNRSSMHVSAELLKSGKGDAFFTVGNTGAAVAVCYFTVGLIEGISRPALSIIYPAMSHKKVVLLDLGATMDARAEHLYDFAVLGEAFSQCITGKDRPEISLLSVGEENIKGKSLVIDAAEKIKQDFNYHGFIEGNHLFKDPYADVIITDGFTGNIMLKVIEGLSETIYDLIKEKVAPHRKWFKISSYLFKHIFSNTFSRFNYTLYGSAILLGFNSLVGIGHGRSNTTAFKTGILTLSRYSDNNLFDAYKTKVRQRIDNKNRS